MLAGGKGPRSRPALLCLSLWPQEMERGRFSRVTGVVLRTWDTQRANSSYSTGQSKAHHASWGRNLPGALYQPARPSALPNDAEGLQTFTELGKGSPSAQRRAGCFDY